MLFVGLTTQAQQAATATGGDASGSGGTVAYSVGQVAYATNTGTNGSAAEGVQQPFEIFIVGIKETPLNISLTAFPNPVIDILTLYVQDFNNEKLSYQLFDMQGKILMDNVITVNPTQLNMSGFPVATYFINVNKENKTVQTFKIIKN